MLRLLLEVHPDFLVVRIDLRNAYNESRRAQVLQRMAAVPGVASLAPLMHAMYGPAGIIVLPDGSRLFAGSDRGDFEEGLPQGSPESSLAFCVLIQEAVQELHEALAGGGGGATRSFDFDTPDLRMSTLLASDSHLGHAFSDAWASLREEVDGVVDVTQSPGLLVGLPRTLPSASA